MLGWVGWPKNFKFGILSRISNSISSNSWGNSTWCWGGGAGTSWWGCREGVPGTGCVRGWVGWPRNFMDADILSTVQYQLLPTWAHLILLLEGLPLCP